MARKNCIVCDTLLTEANWRPSSQRGHYHICNTCQYQRQKHQPCREISHLRPYHNEYRKSHHEQIKLSQQKQRRKVKTEIISHYSPNLSCVRCGFNDIRALSIDHIDGGGKRQKEEIGVSRIGGIGFYRWLIRNNFPEGFQVLCMNCQFIKRIENHECG